MADERNVGRLLAIGGAEDPDEDHMQILPYFVEMCGKRSARIIVCGAPSEKPKEKERKYRALFEKIGVADVYEASIAERHDGEDASLVDCARRATGVFFTGGDQLRLTSLVAGTKFGDVVADRLFNDGLVVGGTSAGAAAMSSTMVISGSSEGTVRRKDVQLAPGLNYWRDAMLDTHFSQRGRVSRVFTVFAQNPQILGIGIDENTAIDVELGHRFTVIGEGVVSVFDGTVTHSNASQVSDEEVLAITDSLVHVLPAGYGFDIPKKRPLYPSGKEIPKRVS
jgi:cyanophycinase